MGEYIILADETIVQNSYVVKLDNENIAVYAYGQYTFTDIYALFGNIQRTNHMVSHQHQNIETWDGYTEVTAIVCSGDHASVNLRKQ